MKHTAKFDRCLKQVKARGTARSPGAVCTAALGAKAFKKNPGQFARAADLFESFRDAKPKTSVKVSIPTPRVASLMGVMTGIDYETDHAGKQTLYRHRFAAGSRPYLAASPDGRQLLIIGGRFRWDHRGIVDYDRDGRAILPASHARNPGGFRKTARAVKARLTGEDLGERYRGFTVRPYGLAGFKWGVFRGKHRLSVASSADAAKRMIDYLLERQAIRRPRLYTRRGVSS